MQRFVTTAVFASLLCAAPAFAFESAKTPHRGPSPPVNTAVLQCDDGVDFSAFFQLDTRRYGNNFNFGLGSRLTSVEITHFGYFTLSGPYLFDIELWDGTTCTFISSVDNLAAADAFDHTEVETFNVCPANLVAAGSVNVVIDANSCAAPNDCYPDIEFDDTFPTCQRIITPPATCQTATNGGNFLLRVDLNNCPTPTLPMSWGSVKQRYR